MAVDFGLMTRHLNSSTSPNTVSRHSWSNVTNVISIVIFERLPSGNGIGYCLRGVKSWGRMPLILRGIVFLGEGEICGRRIFSYGTIKGNVKAFVCLFSNVREAQSPFYGDIFYVFSLRNVMSSIYLILLNSRKTEQVFLLMPNGIAGLDM